MNYASKSRTELQELRNRFLTALSNDRLNSTNRTNIEGWISQIEAELVSKAPVAKVTVKTPTIKAMRDGSAEPQNANDRNRLAMSFMS